MSQNHRLSKASTRAALSLAFVLLAPGHECCAGARASRDTSVSVVGSPTTGKTGGSGVSLIQVNPGAIPLSPASLSGSIKVMPAAPTVVDAGRTALAAIPSAIQRAAAPQPSQTALAAPRAAHAETPALTRPAQLVLQDSVAKINQAKDSAGSAQVLDTAFSGAKAKTAAADIAVMTTQGAIGSRRDGPRIATHAEPYTSSEVEEGLRRFFEENPDQIIDSLFLNSPKINKVTARALGWQEIRTRLGFPIGNRRLAKSRKEPVFLGRNELVLWKGNIFRNQHFAKSVPSVVKISDPNWKSDDYLNNPPWLEWNAQSKSYQYRNSGAKEKILGFMNSAATLYRAADQLEGDMLLGARKLYSRETSRADQLELSEVLKAILRQWRLDPRSKEEIGQFVRLLKQGGVSGQKDRRKYAGMLVDLISLDNTDSIFTAASPSLVKSGIRAAGLKAHIDFSEMPPAALRGVYIGFELDYIEVAFMSTEAKLYLLKHLELEEASR